MSDERITKENKDDKGEERSDKRATNGKGKVIIETINRIITYNKHSEEDKRRG